MHRHWVAPILIVLPLALAACARADGPAVPPAGPGVAASGPFAQVARDGTTHASLFQATLTVDAAGLRAALAPSPVRTATGNDQLAFLDLGAFFNPNTLKVHAVTFGQGTVDVVLQVAHPFPAPDLTQPASATNRADLGFAGRLVVLAEVPIADRPSHSFFGGQVTADTSLVANPDGYVQPRGLIPTAGFANTFPYVLVVDEDKDNRLGVSNQGIPRGNYLPAVGGWQRLNLGPERNGWTGYGYLHQGQTAEITLRLNREALAHGPVTLPVVLLGKHVQPKGGLAPRDHLLPPVQVKTDWFAYRMPYGAIDVERVEAVAARVVAGDPSVSGTVEVKVRDWDARALPTAHPSLALETDVARIQQGGVGAPSVLVDAPALDPSGPIALQEVDPGTRSGQPGDELRYRGRLANAAGRPAGTWWAMAQIIDPEAADPARYEQPYQLDLTRDQQPILDPALRLDPVTFQAIPIVVEPRSAAPTCVECHLSTGRYHATRPFTTNLTGLADDSPSLTLAFSYTGPATGASGTITLPTAEWGTASAFSPWGDPRLTAPLPAPAMGGVYQLHITADDGDQRVTFGPFGFQVVPAGGCPVVPPFSGTPVTTRGAFAGRGDLATLRPVEFLEPDAPPVLAVAGYRDRSGWLLVQGRSGEFYRYAPATAALEPATAGYPGPGWNNRAHLLDLDHRGHAIWVAGNIDQSKTPDPGLGDIYANAGSVVHLFNAAGPGPATAEWTSFDVGKPVVALCVDEDDAIWVVDNTNTLRRYTDTGGGYAEDIDSGIALGSATAGGILGESIYDIDLDYHNRAFFLVVKQLGDRLAVWRVECNGDLEQPNGHTNPVDDVTGGPLRDAAIAIDNYGVHGQVLTGQQDAQILVAVENGLGWLGILTSDLERTASWTGTQGASRLALLYREGQAVTLADQSGAAGSRLLDFWLMGGAWQ